MERDEPISTDLCETLVQIGQKNEVIQALVARVLKSPKDTEAWFQLGQCIENDLLNFEFARECFEKAKGHPGAEEAVDEMNTYIAQLDAPFRTDKGSGPQPIETIMDELRAQLPKEEPPKK